MRLLLIFLALTIVMMLPFFIWGDLLETSFQEGGAARWLEEFGPWGWLMAILLLIGDLLLPLPGTLIMSALGYIYGIFLGGLLSAVGAFLAGSIAYECCRMMGRGAALWLLGEKDLARGEKLFSHIGVWLVVLSRWLPVFPEVIACLAGLTDMPRSRFYLAMGCGVLPLGFVYASIGAAGVDNPGLALILSAGLPPVLWLIVQAVIRVSARNA
ncbi:MAG: VTT domain-containing protein [Bacteroidota bacterium]